MTTGHEFGRISVEAGLAMGAAKVVGGTIERRLEFRALLVNFHLADWVYGHSWSAIWWSVGRKSVRHYTCKGPPLGTFTNVKVQQPRDK
jgi:hypothetical protein